VVSNKLQTPAFHRRLPEEFYLLQKTSKVFPATLQQPPTNKKKDSKTFFDRCKLS